MKLQTGRLGEEGISNQGCKMRIVAYRNAYDIDVLLVDTFGNEYLCKGSRYGLFQLGHPTHPYHRSVLGVGYYGEGPYLAKIKGNHTDYYKTWRAMLSRCYDSKVQVRQPAYVGCCVCDEWYNFQVFAQWMCDNHYTVGDDTMHLDKDILFIGNKVYSPDTCVFVPRRLNQMLTHLRSTNSGLPVGVHKMGKGYQASVQTFSGTLRLRKYVGTYRTPEQAFAAYKSAKEKHIKEKADEYKDRIPQKLYEALCNYEVQPYRK